MSCLCSVENKGSEERGQKLGGLQESRRKGRVTEPGGEKESGSGAPYRHGGQDLGSSMWEGTGRARQGWVPFLPLHSPFSLGWGPLTP